MQSQRHVASSNSSSVQLGTIPCVAAGFVEEANLKTKVSNTIQKTIQVAVNPMLPRALVELLDTPEGAAALERQRAKTKP